ncbi:MAG: hypothetical protein EOS54_18825 [Mesorhizobium sp.]|uniref:hypothetical protein n=1 Tax=unclassified Mesorhizobium TaxID=325217 RepID=UPI000FD19A39|nr:MULTISPECIES: hypothetical protein [unclassified Mesorhizobium]RVD44740.1 hypothetical protein EN742_01405 [Mesorhizobium sp. M4A.F.Ca.ET.020.02.1.1]RWC10811.1 MAG: hypothetical protein EOS53_28410 [Mesorhizobium sp.]RWC26000.1 MAG: hypothetical protein EOS70_32430 [Mesorhizobium sp.]RWC51606.1 MAG: hypothetical protein EOS54_18825 [Mesorhizobium sp.]RWD40300.1 MAG: hypothetical protein EOS35_32060 [Mesorhizobium sp.]
MHHILERLAAKITQAHVDPLPFEQLRKDHMVDTDVYREILLRHHGDNVYQSFHHAEAIFPSGRGLTEKTAQRQKPEDRLLCSDMRDTHHKAQITARDIPNILDEFGDSIKVLSLDCFDTLLWRKTATPEDVFAVLADNPVARSLGITPHQRISAAARAYRAKRLENGSRQIDIHDIYRPFTSLSGKQRELLAETEIQTEMDVCFAFSPYVELIRMAHTRDIKVIIVSDMYLREGELRRLLAQHLPTDVMQAISKVYSSVDYGTSKRRDLFEIVIKECGIPASHLLHIGDDAVADAQVPQKLGVRALHFLQFEREVADFLRVQHAASSLIVFGQAAPKTVVLPCYSPFRPIFSMAELRPYAPETMIGYMSFGPVLYGYARFLLDEVEALQQQGKRVKVLFLLRDGYLLSAACEAYAGEPVGMPVRIRGFGAIAASFKTRADVDHYLSGINPEYQDVYSAAKQLLIPPEVTELLIQVAHQSADPIAAFYQLLREDDVLELIVKNSSAFRARLIRYMKKKLKLEEGDTIVLADTGYKGTTQEYLIRAVKEELKVDIIGRYMIAADVPQRPAESKALITTSWWDYDLFEQCCTVREGAVVDYDLAGEPVLEEMEISEKQDERVVNIQAECVRFISDARAFFTKAGVTHDYSTLQQAAHAALFRHAHMPIEKELEHFKEFRHDTFMELGREKTIYNLENTLKNVRRLPSPYRLGAYDTRGLGLDFTFSALVQRRFQLVLGPEDMSVRFSPLKISVGRTGESKVILLRAHHLHDGYFSIMLPYVSGTGVRMLLGEHYEWLQIEELHFLDNAGSVCGNMSSSLDLEEIYQEGEIYRCLSQASAATIRPVGLREFKTPHYHHMIFRPLVSRVQAS